MQKDSYMKIKQKEAYTEKMSRYHITMGSEVLQIKSFINELISSNQKIRLIYCS